MIGAVATPRSPLIKPLPGLLAELAVRDHLLEQRGRLEVSAVLQMLFEVLGDTQPHIEPDERALISNRFFEHPVATGKTHLVTERLSQIQGRRRTWFCGSYLREPFCHEQALGIGQDVALRLIESDTAAD